MSKRILKVQAEAERMAEQEALSEQSRTRIMQERYFPDAKKAQNCPPCLCGPYNCIWYYMLHAQPQPIPFNFCRFVAIMAPAVMKLQRLLHLPGIQDPQTPHEAWFTKHFQGRLLAAVAALQTPDKEIVGKPERVGNELKSLLRAISTSMK